MQFRRFSHISLPLFLLLLTAISGCFPTACQRRESRALFPADSLSRQIAEQTAIDTLAVLWETTGSFDHPFEYPRTVRYDTTGILYVSDAQANKIFEYEPAGVLHRIHSSPIYTIPYLAGIRGDTLLVFNPETRRIDFTIDGRSVSHTSLPDPLPDSQGLQYASSDGSSLHYKLLGEDFAGYIKFLDDKGTEQKRIPLPGPHWRHAGQLRMWGDSLLSLSAFRPVVDIVTPAGELDSLALVGFDSPMLSRSRSFILGDVHEPPLLSPSAAATGDMLFAINLRPGWLRIDAFDRSGRLQRRLVQRDPDFSKAFYPIDLDVRKTEDGEYELAVVFVEPEPKMVVYRWVP